MSSTVLHASTSVASPPLLDLQPRNIPATLTRLTGWSGGTPTVAHAQGVFGEVLGEAPHQRLIVGGCGPGALLTSWIGTAWCFKIKHPRCPACPTWQYVLGWQPASCCAGCQVVAEQTIDMALEARCPATQWVERDALELRPSVFDDDHVCLNLAFNSPAAKFPGNRRRRDVGCLAKPGGVVRLDLIA
jgi:hypothetical protein